MQLSLFRVLFIPALLVAGCGPDCLEPPCDDLEPTPTVTPVPDPYADRVTRFDAGEGAGFGQDYLPDIVLGPPNGGGTAQGSTHVLSLGIGGLIEIEFVDIVPIDGDGIDLIVFENAFWEGGNSEHPFVEPGIVSASADGVTWATFPCAPETSPYAGCAGVAPVYAGEASGISPIDPAAAGGDAFDLATVGLSRARFLRIEDAGLGNLTAPSSGFDLDAVAVVHGE